jgi:hypothetical protein
MTWLASTGSALGRAVVLGCSIVLFLCGDVRLQPASAASGPFAELPGQWAGTGTIRLENKNIERIRCSSTNRLRGSSQSEIDLQLKCESDSYKFEFVGDVDANTSNSISGHWTERTRNVGGTVIGSAHGNRIQIHIESSAFAGDLVIVTRGRRMSVNIDSAGGGVRAQTSITLEPTGRR